MNGVDPNGIILVSQLFNSNLSGWDVHKLNWWFESSTVDLILKIPIFPTSYKDQWAWTCTISRDVSVKSVYWCCRELAQQNIAPFWNCICKANLHDKHKMMIWRIARGCLPTKDKLSRFVDDIDTYCPLCKMETETSLHLFALCPVAKPVWFNSKWGLKMDSFGFSFEVDFILFLCSPPVPKLPCQKDELLLFGAILCDGIWKLRNQVIFEDLPLSCDDLIARVGKLFMEFENSRLIASAFVNTTHPLQTWAHPRRLYVKINIDAAIGPFHSSLALVARDWRGDLVFACMFSKSENHLPSPGRG